MLFKPVDEFTLRELQMFDFSDSGSIVFEDVLTYIDRVNTGQLSPNTVYDLDADGQITEADSNILIDNWNEMDIRYKELQEVGLKKPVSEFTLSELRELDQNDDGVIDNTDVQLLNDKISNTGSFYEAALDLDGDSFVDGFDTTLLFENSQALNDRYQTLQSQTGGGGNGGTTEPGIVTDPRFQLGAVVLGGIVLGRVLGGDN